MKKEISVRDYRLEDVQALVSIYYNTIHKINIQHYREEQVDVWAPATSLETEGWAKKFDKFKEQIIRCVHDCQEEFVSMGFSLICSSTSLLHSSCRTI